MKKYLKIANYFTAYVSLLALVLFLYLFIQTTLKVNYNIFLQFLTEWLLVGSFIISMPVAVILFCVRRFIYKENISSIFTILISIETLLTYLICFNVGNILYYVFD